jgi:ribosomal protein S18 acetylase RimI-like enzyme
MNAVPVAYAQFAPRNLLPQTENYGSSLLGRVEDEIIFLSCLFISKPEYREMGLGSKVLESVISTLKLRGFKKIETIAREGSQNNPSGPVEFYLKHGFQIKEKLAQNFALMSLKI